MIAFRRVWELWQERAEIKGTNMIFVREKVGKPFFARLVRELPNGFVEIAFCRVGESPSVPASPKCLPFTTKGLL